MREASSSFSALHFVSEILVAIIKFLTFHKNLALLLMAFDALGIVLVFVLALLPLLRFALGPFLSVLVIISGRPRGRLGRCLGSENWHHAATSNDGLDWLAWLKHGQVLHHPCKNLIGTEDHISTC